MRDSEGSIRPLTRETLEERLDELIEIDRGTIGEPWQDRHFRLDLPDKWDHSALLVEEGKVQGFVIVSRKPRSLHVHRIVVAPASRSRGYGPRLLAHVAARAGRNGVPNVTLRVSSANPDAVRFYDRLGFRPDAAQGELLDMSISARDLELACAPPDR